MGILHIKLLFAPIDVQDTLCPVSTPLILGRDKPCSCKPRGRQHHKYGKKIWFGHAMPKVLDMDKGNHTSSQSRQIA